MVGGFELGCGEGAFLSACGESDVAARSIQFSKEIMLRCGAVENLDGVGSIGGGMRERRSRRSRLEELQFEDAVPVVENDEELDDLGEYLV